MMSSIEERAERARRGSKRKRDLDALAEDEARRRAPIDDVDHWETWAQAIATLAEDVTAATLEAWLLPLEPIGERAGAVVLTGRPTLIAWISRRYGGRIAEAVGQPIELLPDAIHNPERTP